MPLPFPSLISRCHTKYWKIIWLVSFQCRNLFIFICHTMQFDNRHHFIPHHDIRYKNNLLIKSYHQRKQIPMLFYALVQEKIIKNHPVWKSCLSFHICVNAADRKIQWTNLFSLKNLFLVVHERCQF